MIKIQDQLLALVNQSYEISQKETYFSVHELYVLSSLEKIVNLLSTPGVTKSIVIQIDNLKRNKPILKKILKDRYKEVLICGNGKKDIEDRILRHKPSYLIQINNHKFNNENIKPILKTAHLFSFGNLMSNNNFIGLTNNTVFIKSMINYLSDSDKALHHKNYMGTEKEVYDFKQLQINNPDLTPRFKKMVEDNILPLFMDSLESKHILCQELVSIYHINNTTVICSNRTISNAFVINTKVKKELNSFLQPVKNNTNNLIVFLTKEESIYKYKVYLDFVKTDKLRVLTLVYTKNTYEEETYKKVMDGF